MCVRSLLAALVLLAAVLLPGEHARGQRAGIGRKRAQISTRPITPRAEQTAEHEADVDAEETPLRPVNAESPQAETLAPVGAKKNARPKAKVTSGTGSLPNDHGQVWREYDLAPYIERVPDSARPEQAIVDWVLRETGYEVWHSEPLGVLSATSKSLRVYHTPEMQGTVAEIVDRFVNPTEATHAIGLQIISVGNPNWRSRAPAKLNPVEVQSAGLQAWLLAKEEAVVLLETLRKRNDFREYGGNQTSVMNGQPTVVSATRPRKYTQHLLPGVAGLSTYEPHFREIEEGIAVELTPLVSLDGESIDAVIRCNLDQVERVVPVAIETGLSSLARERTKVEVPQRSQLRVKETFRWGTDQVLLISLGLGPSPTPADANLLEKAIPLSLPAPPPRVEVLLVLESRGRQKQSTNQPGSARRTEPHGRY